MRLAPPSPGIIEVKKDTQNEAAPRLFELSDKVKYQRNLLRRGFASQDGGEANSAGLESQGIEESLDQLNVVIPSFVGDDLRSRRPNSCVHAREPAI